MGKDAKGHGSDKRGMRGGADYTPNSPGPGFAGTRATKTRLQAESDAYMKKHAKGRGSDSPNANTGYLKAAKKNITSAGVKVRSKIAEGKVHATTKNRKY